ncbi:MAG: ATP-binding cassette domain-containing protein, partial [Bacteroidetes bacterium]|nr:ATP-binding cassette domain-containing protein [Bacteroidota bacterium]
MSIIQINNLHKTYTDTKVPVKAVNGISLSIEEGEFTAIVGPSGSGKTTFLNLMGGLDTPTEGDILIGGKNIKDLNSRQLIDFRLHHIGFVFQSYNLIPVLTAIENVAFIMELQGIPKKERHQIAMELLKKTGLEGKENYRPGE